MRGKVVLITGASSGIGAGTAVHFAAKGCLLALIDIDKSGLQDTLQECVQSGAKENDVLLIPADLTEFENLYMIVEKTVGKFGRLDVLVNNAGCCILGDLAKTSYEDYDTVMNINLKAVFFLTQAALPHIIEAKGNVVNVSSVASFSISRLSIVYNMSKAALDHFTRTLALDVASKGVRVNAVNPGPIQTPIYDKAGVSFSVEEYSKKRVAMKRTGTVSEIAKTIAFLADDEQTSFTTGVTLLTDGGTALVGPI